MTTKARRIYDQVFQHPMTHNLVWRDLKSLFEETGQVELEHNGHAKVTIHGQSMVFHSPADDLSLNPEQITQIRHLYKHKGGHEPTDGQSDALVVISHAATRIYRMTTEPGEPETVTRYDPRGKKTHVHTHHEDAAQGDNESFETYFSEISEAIKTPDRIVIFGSGTGSSNMSKQFVEWVEIERKLLAERIIGVETIDQSHLTEPELLAKARPLFHTQLLAK